LHHLNEFERNGGQRIINLIQGGKTIIDIHYFLDEQNKKNFIARIIGVILLSIFVLFPWQVKKWYLEDYYNCV
jgi:hypothetical protein